MNAKQLNQQAKQIRRFLLESLSQTGGHLSSNLGLVETTLALHQVFDAKKDRFLFDVGHQAYTHKILTGRASQFSTLRQWQGLSGFQKFSEGDCFEAGHASTSISAALGMAIARDLQNQHYDIIALIGDGSLTGGMAMEALNDLGAQQRKVIIIYNDNNMSISKNQSGLQQHWLTHLRSSSEYRQLKQAIKSGLNAHEITKPLARSAEAVKDKLKSHLVPSTIFQAFNLDYLGPIDGHDFHALIPALLTAKAHQGPIVVHVLTKKGKGYAPAEHDQTGQWHGVGPFDIDSAQFLQPKTLSWSQLMAQELTHLAKQDEKIVAITPAMEAGSALGGFHQAFPSRFFDVGIAEEHAVTMAAYIAQSGLKPYVSIYSTFLQRAYDQVLHDVARIDAPVVFGIDRAGLVGEDGDTHQGIYDIAYLSTIPNLILSQPKDASEAKALLRLAFSQNHPFCIRYPKGGVTDQEALESIEIGRWTKDILGQPKQVILTYGVEVDRLKQKLIENKIGAIVVNCRFFNPLDTEMLDELAQLALPMIIYEPDSRLGGLSSLVSKYYMTQRQDFQSISIQDGFVAHGSVKLQRKHEKVSLEDVIKACV